MFYLLVNIGFQVLFHSPLGVLFTFPSRYYALSVAISYLALGGGPPCFPPDSSCPAVLRVRLASLAFRLRGSYPLRPGFPSLFHLARFRSLADPLPRRASHNGLGSCPFARRYSGNRCFFLFLRVLRCFTSPGSLCVTMYSLHSDGALPPPGSPIRISRDLRPLAAPPSFSQLTASFFGVWRLGIHPALFLP